MTYLNSQHHNYQRIAKAIAYLQAHHEEQPNLAQLSAYVGLSETHLQRTFREWAGISPKQFLLYLSKRKAKQLLVEHSVSEAAMASGLSGGNRLYDLMIQSESITPGEYKTGGAGMTLHYGTHLSPFGYCFLGFSHRGLCKLAFYDTPEEAQSILREFKLEWPKADIIEDPERSQDYLSRIFCPQPDLQQTLRVVLRGTEFQLLVWEALLKIPEGQLCSYQDVARSINKPAATRAVASAIARNNLAYLIPCHRVIRSTGEINQYRWGSLRKRAMIAKEVASSPPASSAP